MRNVFWIVVLGLFVSSCAKDHKLDIYKATVSVTNMAKTSGGSGSIVSTGTGNSRVVLTNSHVCEVVKNGGFVNTWDDRSHLVIGYLKDTVHDLCLIHTATELGPGSKISTILPQELDPLLVSGHPRLLPTIQTSGHLSGRRIFGVMSQKECDAQDRLNPNTAMVCQIFGVLPIVISYETVVVSALIQPGSSGSGIYNEKGNIIGVIFAGSGDIGFGIAVPLEYVLDFLNRLATLQPVEVKYDSVILRISSSSIQEKCEIYSFDPVVKLICDRFYRIWTS